MNKLLKIISKLLIFAYLSNGCEQNTTEYIEGLNEAPQINLLNNGDSAVLVDSIKTELTLKEAESFYEVVLSVNDANDNLVGIEYFQLQGIGTLLQEGDTIIDRNIALKDDVLTFEYYPAVYGKHVFQLVAKDEFDARNSIIVELTAFENLMPVAILSVERDGGLGRYHFEFEADESYDRDSKYGGALIEYEFSLLDKRFRILEKKMEYVFPGSGVYEIGLRVKDNNGKWSPRVTDVISIDD